MPDFNTFNYYAWNKAGRLTNKFDAIKNIKIENTSIEAAFAGIDSMHADTSD